MKAEKRIERRKNLVKVVLSSVLFFNIAYYLPQLALAEAKTQVPPPKVAVEGIPANPQNNPGDNPYTPGTEKMLPEKVHTRVPAKTYKNRNANPTDLKQEDCRTVKGKMRCAPKVIEERN